MGPGDAAGSGTAIKSARFHVKRHLCLSGPGVIAAVFSWRLRSAEPHTVPVPAAPRFRQPRRRQTRPGPCAMTVRTPEHAGCFSYRGREPIPVGRGAGPGFRKRRVRTSPRPDRPTASPSLRRQTPVLRVGASASRHLRPARARIAKRVSIQPRPSRSPQAHRSHASARSAEYRP